LTTETNDTGFRATINQFSNLNQHKQAQPELVLVGLEPALALLRTWQSNRLTRTYSDLLVNPEFESACRFFLSDIYAARDFSKRDQDLEYLYHVMSRFLPDFLLKLARKTIELNSLTNTLDQALLKVLVENLQVVDKITPQIYAEGYRICDNYNDRAFQIELLINVGKMVGSGTRLPLINAALRLARRPARLAGWEDVQDFLERGFFAFKNIRKPEKFLGTIQDREMHILDNIFANYPDPFEI